LATDEHDAQPRARRASQDVPCHASIAVVTVALDALNEENLASRENDFLPAAYAQKRAPWAAVVAESRVGWVCRE
jgi:hypothetical protein